MQGCCYLVDEKQLCFEQGDPYRGFILCEEHQELLEDSYRRAKRKTAIQSASVVGFEQYPGFCYVILLPDGTVKIGYSNTEDLLTRRFRDLKNQHGHPLFPLAVLPGGFVTEAILHSDFDHLRVPGPGERFQWSPEIADRLGHLVALNRVKVDLG